MNNDKEFDFMKRIEMVANIANITDMIVGIKSDVKIYLSDPSSESSAYACTAFIEIGNYTTDSPTCVIIDRSCDIQIKVSYIVPENNIRVRIYDCTEPTCLQLISHGKCVLESCIDNDFNLFNVLAALYSSMSKAFCVLDIDIEDEVSTNRRRQLKNLMRFYKYNDSRVLNDIIFAWVRYLIAWFDNKTQVFPNLMDEESKEELGEN